MIAFLDGIVDEVRDGALVVRAGAWGIEVLVPVATTARSKAGEPIRLHTHLAVREDAFTLYGFDEDTQRLLFRALIGVSGVGPKVALAILSSLPRQVIVRAIVEDDPALLSAAPGVGKRTAERIILDLASRLPDALLDGASGDGDVRAPGVDAPGTGPEARDAIAALIALGYREANVKVTITELAIDMPDAPAEALIRKALAQLR
mgnify:CR=1 FL=1